MSNGKTRRRSPLTTFEKLSPNNSGLRTSPVKLLSIHCAAGNISPDNLLGMARFQTYDTINGASCNYAIRDTRVGLGVEETKRAWTTSSRTVDQAAITFELSNSRSDSSDWPMTDATVQTCAEVCVDIAKFYGYKKITYYGVKDKFGDADEMVIIFHKWYANKSCPGPWFERNVGVFVEVCAHLMAGRKARFESVDERTARCVVEAAPVEPPLGSGDNPSAWAKEATRWAIDTGLFGGDGKGNFNWQNPITREEVAALFFRFHQMSVK